MKKILITTFHRADNYGAVLQAYALEKVLEMKGYQVRILDYSDCIKQNYKLFKIDRSSFSKIVKSAISSTIFLKKNLARKKSFEKFRKENLIVTEEEYYALNSINEDADIMITGSDQVWNSLITKGLSDIYTLNFGKPSCKRISYAASIGRDSISKEEIEDYRKKLKKLDCISVRETTAEKLLTSIFPNKNFSVVLDPVLLRKKEEWEEDIINIPKINEKYILTYYVNYNEKYRKIVKMLSERTGLKIIDFGNRNRFNNIFLNAYTKGPIEFVSLIKNAEYIITSSFHGTVFSIIFHKKFWVVPVEGTSRIVDLLKLLKIPECIVNSEEEFKKKDLKTDIDYEKVDEILNRERQKSMGWLWNAIGN